MRPYDTGSRFFVFEIRHLVFTKSMERTDAPYGRFKQCTCRPERALAAKRGETSLRGTQLLDRSIDIILSFIPENKSMSIAEICTKVGLARPTVHRIVHTLEKRKLLIRSDADKRFQLGPMFVHLGHVARESFQLGDWARPTMERLAEASGETVHLAIRVNLAEGAFVEKVESRQSVRLHTRIGQPVPLYTGATLKVILAHLPEREWDEIIESGLEPMAQLTITDSGALKEHLREIRRRGYAVSRDELYNGAGAVAAPILDSAGNIVAGLGISGPTFRLSQERVSGFVPMVQQAAAEIGQFV